MALANLMKDLAAAIGLDNIAFGADGGGQLVIDDDVVVDIRVASGQEGGFVVSALVGPIPLDNREAVYGELLEANLVGDATGGAALAIDPTRSQIALRRRFSDDSMAFSVLDRELSIFVEALSYWRRRCANGEIGKGTEDDSSSADAIKT